MSPQKRRGGVETCRHDGRHDVVSGQTSLINQSDLQDLAGFWSMDACSFAYVLPRLSTVSLADCLCRVYAGALTTAVIVVIIDAACLT